MTISRLTYRKEYRERENIPGNKDRYLMATRKFSNVILKNEKGYKN